MPALSAKRFSRDTSAEAAVEIVRKRLAMPVPISVTYSGASANAATSSVPNPTSPPPMRRFRWSARAITNRMPSASKVATQNPRDFDRISPATTVPNTGSSHTKRAHPLADISRPVTSTVDAMSMISPYDTRTSMIWYSFVASCRAARVRSAFSTAATTPMTMTAPATISGPRRSRAHVCLSGK